MGMLAGVVEAAAMAVFVAAWTVCFGSGFVGLYHLVRAGGSPFEALLGSAFNAPPRSEGRFAATVVHREKVRKARKVIFASGLVGMVAGCVVAGLLALTSNRL